MKRTLQFFALVGCVGILAWIVLPAQTPGPAPPFAGTASIAALDPSQAVIFVRQLNGSYTQLTFGHRPPYNILANMAGLAGLIASGTTNLIAAAAGPPNVGRAAQILAIGKFTSGGALGIASFDYSLTSTVQVALASLSAAYSGFATASYVVGPNVSNAVIAADFNGDGVADLAVPFGGTFDSPQSGVTILINKGDGTFASPVVYAAGTTPYSLAAFDVNHDNILDLVVADEGSNSVYVLLGNGNGTFKPAVAYPAGANNLSVTIGDFNGDHNPDLAVTSSDQHLTILLGNGDGTFRSGSTYSTGQFPNYIAAGDFNNDGILDLVTANTNDSTVTIYLGRGDGTFQTKASYTVGANLTSVVLTDYNQDGILDIIVGQGDARGFDCATEDDSIDFLLGNGDGTFQGTPLYQTGAQNATFLVAANFTGHGYLDALVGDQSGRLILLPSAGPGTFQAPVVAATSPSGALSATVADFNGDGRPDVAVGGSGVSVFLNNGSGGLQAASTFSTGGSTASGIAAADFNSDGKQDLVVANQYGPSGTAPGSVAVFFGAGNGTFQMSQSFSAGMSPSSVAAVDINGDGKPDIVAVDGGSLPGATPVVNGAVYVFLNNGNGTFGSHQLYTFAGNNNIATPLAVGDVNGDGKPDVVVGYQDANFNYHLAVFLNTGNGTLGAPIVMATDFGPQSIVIGDFNGDGQADLVVAHCCGVTDMTFLQGNGDGTFQPEVHFTAAPSPASVVAVDLRGTAKLDLLVAGSSAGVAPMFNTSTTVPAGPVSAIPASGAGSGQPFKFSFTHDGGYQNISVADVLIASALDGRHACYVAFVPSGPGGGSVYLVDDAGDAGGPYQGLVLPGGGSISNSQCTITGANSSVSGSGNTLALTLGITFGAGFSGNKIFYLSSQDKSSNNSGWQAMGTWAVGSPAANGPGVTGMSPARTSGSGPTTYTFSFTDTNGWQDIAVANVLINSAIDGRYGCYLAIVPATNSVFLVDNAGDAAGPYTGLTPGSGTASNSQCAVGGAGAAISGSGNQLTVTLPISFRPSFEGNQIFFLAARSNTVSSNWQAVGSVSVP